MATVQPDTQTTLIIAGIAAFATIIAAIIAAVSAISARRSDSQASRIRDLENRLAEKKYETYKPMLDMLQESIDKGTTGQLLNNEDVKSKMSKFITWISIFGSDDAVKAFHNFRQASFSPPTALVFLRLYVEFILAARRDMGYADTKVTPAQIIGMRIDDLYKDGNADAVTLPIDKVYEKFDWAPPWSVKKSKS